jgi:hypothetical protein
MNPRGYAARQLIVIESQHTARGKHNTQTFIPMQAVASAGGVLQDRGRYDTLDVPEVIQATEGLRNGARNLIASCNEVTVGTCRQRKKERWMGHCFS